MLSHRLRSRRKITGSEKINVNGQTNIVAAFDLFQRLLKRSPEKNFCFHVVAFSSKLDSNINVLWNTITPTLFLEELAKRKHLLYHFEIVTINLGNVLYGYPR